MPRILWPQPPCGVQKFPVQPPARSACRASGRRSHSAVARSPSPDPHLPRLICLHAAIFLAPAVIRLLADRDASACLGSGAALAQHDLNLMQLPDDLLGLVLWGITRPFLDPDCHCRWTTQKKAAQTRRGQMATLTAGTVLNEIIHRFWGSPAQINSVHLSG